MTSLNTDFEFFKKEVSWFISENDILEINNQEEGLSLSNLFIETYPMLTDLLNHSRIVSFQLNGKAYKLISWTNVDNESFGWLIEVEVEQSYELTLCWEHKLLLKELGGIKELYNGPESLADNQNFMFLGSECQKGIPHWEKYYSECCAEENCDEIDYSEFIVFAEEANGSLTMYNPKNNKVMLFSHDHDFDYLESMENQPEYTFHKFKYIKTFRDYVEQLASEWANVLLRI